MRLDRRNVLIGPNMSGKSNILDVFRFLRDMLFPEPGSSGVAHAFNRRSGFSEVAWKGAEPKLLSIAISGDFAAEQEEFIAVGAPKVWTYEITFFANSPTGWASVENEQLIIDTGLQQSPVLKTESGKRHLLNLDGRTVSVAQDSNRSALEFEIPDWDGNVVRSIIESWRFYRLVPSLMRGVNQTAASFVLKESGENISAWLMTLQTRYRREFEHLARTVKDVFPEISDIFAWTTEQATVFTASQERFLKRPTPAWQMSDGQLAFIALASLIFAPDELGSSLYCVEEPENYLHPKLVQTLFTLLNQRQQQLGESLSAQTLLTTHSLQVIDQFDLEDLIVVEKREGATICTRPADKRHLKELLLRDDAGLGQLYYSGSLSGIDS